MPPSFLIRESLLKPKKRKKERKKLAKEMCECRRRGEETQPRHAFSQLFPASDKAWNPLHKGKFVFTDVNQASVFFLARFVVLTLIKTERGLLPDSHHNDILTYAPYCKQYTLATT